MTAPATLHDATGQAISAPNVGILMAYGATVPSDGATGYATGCLFQQTDGSTGTALYVNEGSLTSADFNAFGPAASSLPLAGGTLTDGANIAVGSTTGTKIGTATTQKLGFFNATPIVQRVGADQAILTAITGGESPTEAEHNLVITLVNELRAALIAFGLIKGSA